MRPLAIRRLTLAIRRVAGLFHASGSEFRVFLFFILGHLEFEYAGQHCSRCAWICVCRLQWRTGRTINQSKHRAHLPPCAAEVCSHRSKPLKSTGTLRPANARRLATGAGSGHLPNTASATVPRKMSQDVKSSFSLQLQARKTRYTV